MSLHQTENAPSTSPKRHKSAPKPSSSKAGVNASQGKSDVEKVKIKPPTRKDVKKFRQQVTYTGEPASICSNPDLVQACGPEHVDEVRTQQRQIADARPRGAKHSDLKR